MEPIISSDRSQCREGFAPRSPFGREADAQLLEQLILLKQLFDQGKHTFVLVTHRDPDADAIAACMGVDRLIKATLPNFVRVRWMHDGCLHSSLRDISGYGTEPIRNLEEVIDDPSVALIVLDQPDLNLCTVLPDVLRKDPRFQSREPDLVFDHHGEPHYGSGRVCCPDAGSTSALICRLLDLGYHYNITSTSLVVDGVDRRLALLLNVGARIDAGISVSGQIPANASVFTRWVVDQTQAKVDPKDAALFDVLTGHNKKLLATAQRNQHVHSGVIFEGTHAHLVLSHVGSANSSHCVGACASELFNRALSQKKDSSPLVVVLFGIIRPSEIGEASALHSGGTVHVSIRVEQGSSAEKSAQ